MLKGDSIQIMYKSKKKRTLEILTSGFESQDEYHLYLQSGKYLINNIVHLRNLSKEKRLAEMENEE